MADASSALFNKNVWNSDDEMPLMNTHFQKRKISNRNRTYNTRTRSAEGCGTRCIEKELPAQKALPYWGAFRSWTRITSVAYQQDKTLSGSRKNQHTNICKMRCRIEKTACESWAWRGSNAQPLIVKTKFRSNPREVKCPNESGNILLTKRFCP